MSARPRLRSCAIALGVAVVAVVVANAVATVRARRELEALRALALREAPAPEAPIAPREDAAEEYDRAQRLLSTNGLLDLAHTKPQPVSRALRREIERYLASQAPVFDAIERGLTRPRCTGSYEDQTRRGNLVRLLGLAARDRTLAEDGDGALVYIGRVARFFDRSPGLAWRGWADDVAARHLVLALDACEPFEAACRELGRTLRDPLDAELLRDLLDVRQSYIDPALDDPRVFFERSNVAEPNPVLHRIAPWTFTRDRVRSLASISRVIELARQGVGARTLADARELEQESESLPSWYVATVDMNRLGAGLVMRLLGQRLRRAQMRTALALGAHRIRHGIYPERLDALVPDLLPAIPEDPFGPGSLAYERVGSGFTLGSVEKRLVLLQVAR